MFWAFWLASPPPSPPKNNPDLWCTSGPHRAQIKNLLMPLFLMGCFPVDFQEVKRPLGTKSVKRPIKVGKRPINKGKRPIKAKVLVGVSIGSFMGCFRAPPPWRKTAPLKRPIKRSMNKSQWCTSQVLCVAKGATKGVRQKEFDPFFFFRFRDAFGHFSVTFSDVSVTFFVTFLPNSFCRTPFAASVNGEIVL